MCSEILFCILCDEWLFGLLSPCQLRLEPVWTVDQQFLTGLSGTNNHFTLKVLQMAFLPHSEARFELQQVICTMSTCLNALSCLHVIGWLNIGVNKVCLIKSLVSTVFFFQPNHMLTLGNSHSTTYWQHEDLKWQISYLHSGFIMCAFISHSVNRK